jgi:hypothetical protein
MKKRAITALHKSAAITNLGTLDPLSGENTDPEQSCLQTWKVELIPLSRDVTVVGRTDERIGLLNQQQQQPGRSSQDRRPASNGSRVAHGRMQR